MAFIYGVKHKVGDNEQSTFDITFPFKEGGYVPKNLVMVGINQMLVYI